MSRPNRPLHRYTQVVAAATLTLLAAGCTSDGGPAALPTPSAVTATPNTPTPSPDATPTLDQADAEAAAQAAVHDYLALFAEIGADPNRDVAELEHVAAGRALTWATHQITTWRDDGQRGVGAQVASDFTVTSVVLDPSTTTDADRPTVDLTACVDVSATDLVDQNGDSVVTVDRLDRVLVDYVVANPDWPEEQRWLVIRDDAQLTDSNPPEFVPCD
ncbi:MAG: hypothetical protein ACOC9R_00595 [bacterium]